MTKVGLGLKAQSRRVTGRKVKSLRKLGLLPANIFGKHIDSKAISVNQVEFRKIFTQAGTTALINLKVEDETKTRPVLVAVVQKHPVWGKIIHADFRQVDLAEKVTATVAIKLVGESPAVKDKGAVLVSVINEISIEALPADLPSQIEADVSSLAEFGNSIHVKDLSVDRNKVKILADEGETIVIVQEPKAEVEEAPAAPVEVAPAAEGEAAPTPAEGTGKVSEEKAETGKKESSKSPDEKK